MGQYIDEISSKKSDLRSVGKTLSSDSAISNESSIEGPPVLTEKTVQVWKLKKIFSCGYSRLSVVKNFNFRDRFFTTGKVHSDPPKTNFSWHSLPFLTCNYFQMIFPRVKLKTLHSILLHFTPVDIIYLLYIFTFCFQSKPQFYFGQNVSIVKSSPFLEHQQVGLIFYKLSRRVFFTQELIPNYQFAKILGIRI